MKDQAQRPAIFLDRDGTLIEDRGFIHSPEEVCFYPEIFPALKKVMDRYLLFIVTNQPGIGLGILQKEEVERVNNFIVATLARQGITIQKVYLCPHLRDEGCECIKPNPYFLLLASEEFSVDLSRSYVIGDHPSDAEMAKATGARGIYLLTGHGRKHLPDLSPDVPVCHNLEEAINLILEEKDPVHQAALILRRGGVVAFPTETVYGLGADAFNPLAVARVFEIKRRPHFDPLIVHIAREDELERLAREIPAKARKLIECFWPGPLTLVLSKKEEVPEIVTSGLPTVAVRMPRHPLTLRLIELAGTPIVGPSANPFGYLSPTTANHVREQLGQQVDFILDGGPCEVGVESTILSLLEDTPRLLRPGGVPLEDIESIIGKVVIQPKREGKPEAPGMLPRHYSPRTPIILDWSEEDLAKWKKEGKRIGLLSFRGKKYPLPFAWEETLSSRGDLREAAANLFSALHRLDSLGLDLILAENIPETGLGRTIMDRLRRASSPGKNQGESSSFSHLP